MLGRFKFCGATYTGCQAGDDAGLAIQANCRNRFQHFCLHIIVCLVSHIWDQKNQLIARQKTSNPTLQCFFAFAGSWIMKSIVVSASEFMIAAAKPFEALRREPWVRICSIKSA